MSRRSSLTVGATAVLAGAIGGRLLPSASSQGNSGRFVPGHQVFVSAEGDDRNSGSDPARPMRSITRALARIGSESGVVSIRPGDRIVLDETIALDVSLHRLVGDKSVIDASRLPSGSFALDLYASRPQPLLQPWPVLENLEIAGRGRDHGGGGLRLGTPPTIGKAAVAHVSFHNLAVHDFGTAIQFGDNAYCVTFANCIIGKSETCVLVPDNLHNAGERLEFLACTVFDSTTGMDVRSPAAELTVIGSSIDYCRTLVNVENGRVHLIGCHLEFDRSREEIPLRTSGKTGGIVMLGGKLNATTKSGPLAVDYVIQNDADRTAGSSFVDVWMTNLSTRTGDFSGGSGSTRITGEKTTPADYRSFTVIGESANLLADGRFEDDQIVDPWVPLTRGRPLEDDDASIVIQPQAHAGRRALVVRSDAHASARPELLVTVAAPRDALPRGRFSYLLTSGSVDVTFESALIRPGRAAPAKSARIGSPVTLEAHPDEWKVARSPLPVARLAPWATHLVVRFSLAGLTSESLLAIADVNLCTS